MTRHLQLIAGTIAAAILIAASPAMAQPRVVVFGFSGPQGSLGRAGVVQALRTECQIVELPEWHQAARKLGASGVAPRNLARVAAELRVKAIVVGGLARAGRQWRLDIAVRDGADGQVVGRAGRTLRALSGVGGVGSALGRQALGFVAQARGVGRARRPDPPAEPRERPPNPDHRDDPPRRPSDHRDDPPRRPPDREHRPNEEERPAQRPAPPSHGPSHPWLWLALEVNAAARNFAVHIGPIPRTEARHETGLFPEFGVRLAFYPGGVFSDEWYGNIGIEGAYHHHLYLSGKNLRSSLPFEVEEYTFHVGLTYRFIIGDEVRGATIIPRIGFGRYSMFMGDTNNDIVPSFDYDHIYIGFNGHIPLATRYVGLDLGFDYLAIISMGDAAVLAYNAEGANPTAHGFRFFGGLSGRIVAGLHYRTGFEILGVVSHHYGLGNGWGDTRQDRFGPGLETTDAAKDFLYRLVFQISYWFG